MISQAQYESFRELFYNRVVTETNGADITLQFIGVAYGDSVDQFLGEGVRTVTSQHTLKCLYRWVKSDKMRENMGVTVDTSVVAYISPIELQAKTGSASIPAEMMSSFRRMKVQFIGKTFEIIRVTEVEPMVLQGGVMCIAYQFDLKDLVV